MASIRETYLSRTSRSRNEQPRFTHTMPGGDTRSVARYEPYPIVLVSGDGAVIRDLDGNEYLDVLNNYTCLIHGHGHPAISSAIREAIPAGIVFPAPHLSQAALASHLIERLPAVDLVRFTSSGSEAATLAFRLARHVTGRGQVIVFDGGFHGTGEPFADRAQQVIQLPYNDVAALRQAVDSNVAAVFVEPFLGSAGVIGAQLRFLRAIQDLTRQTGALFVLDEIQALRNHYHGTHAALGLDPDLVLLGKIIGGGLPVGAVGGRAEILGRLSSNAPSPLPHSGTFNGNVLSMVAGLASMQLLTEDQIASLDARAAHVQAELPRLARDAGLGVTVTRAGSILNVHFLEREPTRYADVQHEDRRAGQMLHLALLNRGVFAAPRGMLNLSTVLTDADVAAILDAYADAFRAISAEREPASSNGAHAAGDEGTSARAALTEASGQRM
jgi:glutamate-1-semialdehyde 2,1-aminomutase